MHTAAILDEHFQVMSGVNTPNDYMGPGTDIVFPENAGRRSKRSLTELM